MVSHVEATIVHDSISGSGSNTHAQVDSHIADATQHRLINDAGALTTELWSASKITSELSSQVHDTADITTGTFADARIAASNVTQHVGSIDHNSTLNFVAAEHINWTGDAGASNIHDNNVVASTITQHVASIDHDATLNFAGDEHIAHSGVSVTAGLGLTGGGTIAATRTLDLDVSDLIAITVPAAADELAIYDSGVGQRKITFANIEATLDHDALAGYVAGEHILHSGVDITAGEGLTGGGSIAATRTIDIDVNGLTADALPAGATDYVVTYDASAGSHKKVLLDNLPITETVLQNNTGDNVGIGGTGPYKGMNGTILEFRNINSTSSRLTVTLDGVNDEIDLDVVEGNININNLLNAGALAALDVVGTSEITDSVVTYAKLQNISATARVLGRNTAGAGVAEEITETQFKTLFNLEIGTDVQAYDADTAKLDVVQSFTAEQTFKEVVETQYSLTGTVLDPVNGTLQYKTLSANTTFTESLANGQAITLMIDDGTAYTVTWPTITWVGGSAPTLPTTGYAVIELWQINGVLYGMHSGDA